MGTYVARRLLLLPLVAFGVTVLIFALLQFLSPAQRAALFVTNPNQLAQIDGIIRKYGLDKPAHVQYWIWLKELARGDLGWSQTARMPTSAAIGTFFPATLELTSYIFIPVVLIGLWLGTKAAVHKDRFVDHFSRFVAISLRGLPSFVWGLVVLMVFYGWLAWFPPGRLSLEADLYVKSPAFRPYTHLLTLDALLNGQVWVFLDALRHIVGPAMTLVLVEMALLVRVTRSSMLEVLRQDYVRTARAKGLAEPVVINRHARRNALIPVVTLSSLLFVGLLGGVVLAETIFNYPGIGKWGAEAAVQLDIPGVTGFGMFVAMLTVLGNLAADILAAVATPPVRDRVVPHPLDVAAFLVVMVAIGMFWSLPSDFTRRMKRNPLSIAGFVIVMCFISVAVLAPLLALPKAGTRDPYLIPHEGFLPDPQPPRLGHPFGTTGRQYDIYYGVVWGTRTAFRVAIVVVTISIALGLTLGSIAGYYGTRLDELIMRVTDVFLAFPSLVLAVVITAVLGKGLEKVMIAIAVVGWPVYARLLRGEILSVKQ